MELWYSHDVALTLEVGVGSGGGAINRRVAPEAGQFTDEKGRRRENRGKREKKTL